MKRPSPCATGMRSSWPATYRLVKRRVGVLHAQRHHLAHELQRRVAQQRAGEEVGLAGDLESVADAEHGGAALGVRHDLAHDRAEAGDGAGAEIVAVAEAAGEDHDVDALQVVILVPEPDAGRA